MKWQADWIIMRKYASQIQLWQDNCETFLFNIKYDHVENSSLLPPPLSPGVLNILFTKNLSILKYQGAWVPGVWQAQWAIFFKAIQY